MSKVLALLSTIGLLAVPAASVARPAAHHHRALSVAREQCRQERRAIGVQAFRVKYGTDAFRKCVKAHLPDTRAARRQCRDERRMIGAVAFRQKYGSPNALRKCIEVKTATP